MSVLIKDMAMPKNCDICPLITEADDYHVCYINEQFIPWEWVDEHSAEQRHPKPSWCPLAPVPPHGRLIDADALEDRCSRQARDEWNKSTGTNWGYAYATFESDVEDTPTIIEAEEGE